MSDAHFTAPPSENSPGDRCLSVVMPVFNEAKTVGTVIEKVLAQPAVAELVVVDDGSSDNTWASVQDWAARDPRVRAHRHERNQGKGAALRTGIGLAQAPFVIVQDADLEYDPAEYSLLLRPLLSGMADVVFGSRFSGGAHRVLYYWHSLGNWLLTTLSNMATDLCLTDMETCYKAFRRPVIQGLQLEEERFGFEPEVTAKVARIPGIRIFEVPISYYGRTYAEGKKIGWKDGFRALWCILKYNFIR